MAKDVVTKEEAKEAEEKVGTGSLSVYSAKGMLIRTYTAALHGKEFKKLAEMYAGKVGGEVRK